MQVLSFPESRWWLAAGWTILHFLWVGVALGVLAALFRALTRRAAPQARYLLALACLLAVAAAPAALFIRMLDSGARSAASALPRAGPAPPAAPTTDITPRVYVAVPSPLLAEAPPADKAPATPAQQQALAALLAWRVRSLLEQICRWLPWLWLVGAPATLARLAMGMIGAEWIRSQSRVLGDGELYAACQRVKSSLKIASNVAVAVSDRIASPLLVGIVRPMIVLPGAALICCTPEQCEMILLHELAHVRRWDNLVNLGQRLIEAVLFFHPFVWWLSNWVRLEREHCCDRAVLERTSQPQAYAEMLAALALPGIRPQHAAAAMADHHLVTRIRHILNLEDRSMGVSRKTLSGLIALAITCGWIVVSYAQQADDRSLAAGGAKPSVSADAEAEPPKKVSQNLEAAAEPSPPAGAAALADRVQVFLRDSGEITNLEFSVETPRHWAPEQAVGPPNTPEPGDFATAWASATPDGQEEWLELTYEKPVEAVALMVYESFNPGALYKIIVYDENGNEIQAFSGEDPTRPGSEHGISLVKLNVKKLKVNKVRLYLKSPDVGGWNEIDAVGLLDIQGQTHWATAAKASSTFADNAQIGVQGTWDGAILYNHAFSADPRIAALEQRIQKLEEELASLKQSLGRNVEPSGTP